MRALTPKMIAALKTAGWDRSLRNIDMRVINGLIARGLVDITMGTESYHRGNGVWITRTVVVDVKINEAGTRALS